MGIYAWDAAEVGPSGGGHGEEAVRIYAWDAMEVGALMGRRL